MISEPHLHILRKIVKRLKNSPINWALTGSMSFALQGVPVTPNDIDIQTNAEGAYAIEALFSDYSTRKVMVSSTDRIRSHYGALALDGIDVEIMGDVEKRLPDGTWEAPPDFAQHKRYVENAGMRVPVLALDYEYQAYLTMGRTERAQLLKDFLENTP
jgi:hypothetical protein